MPMNLDAQGREPHRRSSVATIPWWYQPWLHFAGTFGLEWGLMQNPASFDALSR